MTRRHTIAWILVTATIALLASTAAWGISTRWANDHHIGSPRITEDDPRWDCATMGDRQCGPGAIPLTPYCQIESSHTLEGTEMIEYPPHHEVLFFGNPVPCPKG